MKHNILIYGLGNIGFRHVQSLINDKRIDKIFIYDHKKKNYNFFKKKFSHKKKFILFEFQSMKNINFFLAIISTTSKDRYLITKRLIKNNNIKHFLLEKFLDSNLSNLKLFKNFQNMSIFVNYNWRYYPFIRLIKKKLSKQKNLKITLQGNPWNMASNSLHILNAVKFITGKKLKKIHVHKNCKLINSKRTGFNEIIGTIEFKLEENIYLKLISEPNLYGKNMIITNKNLNLKYNFQSSELSYNRKIIISKIKHVSETTNIIYKKLLNRRFHELTHLGDTLSDSVDFLSKIKEKFKSIRIT